MVIGKSKKTNEKYVKYEVIRKTIVDDLLSRIKYGEGVDKNTKGPLSVILKFPDGVVNRFEKNEREDGYSDVEDAKVFIEETADVILDGYAPIPKEILIVKQGSPA